MATNAPRAPARPNARPSGAQAPARPGAPARPTGEVDERSTGRGFAAIPQGPAAVQSPEQAHSPFSTYAPSSDQMQLEAERRREDSLGVIAIVGGLAFMVGSALVVVLAVLIVGLFVHFTRDEQVAGADQPDLGNVLDTAVAAVGPEEGRGPGKGPGPAEDDPLASGPDVGPATVYIPADAMFHSMEVNCPGGFRGRAKFKKGKATVYNVPADERCVATFQGSTYVKDWISGHQTKMCTQFEPTPVCRLR